jgi:Methyltransferase domain
LPPGSQRIPTPAFTGKTVEEIYRAVTANGGDENLPRWPSEEIQKRYTGGSGAVLLHRAANFVELLNKDNAFARPDWKGLDFGCGWGRIATYMLTKGAPDQLDLCDAWNESLEIAKKGGFRNRMFKVSDVVESGELPRNYYDFCYAMSVFTHLSREAFESNVKALTETLVPGGKLYLTVRHKTFLDKMIESGRIDADQKFEADGFWHVTYRNRPHYGETAVEPAYMQRLASRYGELAYLGLPEYEQHLYRITCREPS